MSTRVHESAVINLPASQVWEAVKALDFKFLSHVKDMKLQNGASRFEVGGQRTITYTEGKSGQTTQTIILVGLSEQERTVAWDLVSSTPGVTYSSASHHITVRRVTKTNDAYVEWVTDFSSDANQSVIQDMRFKQLEAFNALASHLERSPVVARNVQSVSKADLMRHATSTITSLWHKYDADHNGVMDRKEFDLFYADLQPMTMDILTDVAWPVLDAKIRANQAPEHYPTTRAGLKKMLTDMMTEELSAVYRQQVFEQMDVNHDGVVSKQEFFSVLPGLIDQQFAPQTCSYKCVMCDLFGNKSALGLY